MNIGAVRQRAADAQAQLEVWQREAEVQTALQAATATLNEPVAHILAVARQLVWAAQNVAKKD